MAKAQFLGVYSLRSVKNASGKRYCFVWRDNAAKTCLFQSLTPDMKPTGKPMLLPLEQFRRDFTPEPGISAIPDIEPQAADYQGTTFSVPISDKATLISGPIQKPAAGTFASPSPRPREEEQVSREEQPASRKATPASGVENAEQPQQHSTPEALDKSIRAEFALSLMRFRRGNKEGALQDFERLLAVEDGIVPAHKHMFTDFGIDLRKSKLYTLASRCFQRAVNLSPNDGHALFNLARIYYEMGNFGKAVQYLDAALDKEPDLKCALRLKMHMRGDTSGAVRGKK